LLKSIVNHDHALDLRLALVFRPPDRQTGLKVHQEKHARELSPINDYFGVFDLNAPRIWDQQTGGRELVGKVRQPVFFGQRGPVGPLDPAQIVGAAYVEEADDQEFADSEQG